MPEERFAVPRVEEPSLKMTAPVPAEEPMVAMRRIRLPM